MFARQPAVEGLSDEGLGRRSRWIAGPTQVTRNTGSCRHYEADDDIDSSVADRDLYRASRTSLHQRERKTVHQRLTHSTVSCQIADVDITSYCIHVLNSCTIDEYDH